MVMFYRAVFFQLPSKSTDWFEIFVDTLIKRVVILTLMFCALVPLAMVRGGEQAPSGENIKKSDISTNLSIHDLDLKNAPVTTRYADLPDLFVDIPPGSKSYHIRDSVVQVSMPPKKKSAGFKGLSFGMVFHIPGKNVFYVQQDPAGASTLHYYGPFKGDPFKKYGLDRPKKRTGGAGKTDKTLPRPVKKWTFSGKKTKADYEAMSFTELRDRYKAMTAELVARKKLCLHASPEYRLLLKTIKNTVIPLGKRAELSRLKVVVVYPGMTEGQRKKMNEKVKGFDKDRHVKTIIWSVFGDIAARVQKIASRDWEHYKQFSYCILHHQGIKKVKNPLKHQVPFEKGSLAYAWFYTDLGEPLHMISAYLAQGIESSLPKAFKEREDHMRMLYDLLRKKAKQEEKGGMPPKHEETLRKAFKAGFSEIAKLTADFWKAKKKGNKPVEDIFTDLIKKFKISQ